MDIKRSENFIEILKKNAVPFSAGMIVGLLSHMFAFTNKLMNADEIESLFGKGATITSGRWGLEAAKIFFPDMSMPWLYGIISIILISVAACVIINTFDLKNNVVKILLSGMILAFPSLTGTFCFMFTSSCYALSFLMVAVSIYIFTKEYKFRWPICIVLLSLSMGIYQAYIALAASLLLVFIIKLCLESDASHKDILIKGFKELIFLVVSVILYLLITFIVLKASGSEFNSYVNENVVKSGLLGKIRTAYDFIVYYLSYREFALITSEPARYAHIIFLAVCAAALIYSAVKLLKERALGKFIILLSASFLLPLAVNCMFLVMDKSSIHTLVIYSFISFYVLGAILTENVLFGSKLTERLCRDGIYICLLISLVSNIYFANEVYLKQYLQYENAYSFYDILLSRAENVPGFDKNSKLALIGYQDNCIYYNREIDTGYISGLNTDLINIYSRENFIRRYMGSDIPLATDAEIEKLKETGELENMAQYPYYGSIKKIGDYIVVKLG